MTLQTHRPQSGWTGDVRQARTKTYTGIRLRRWHTSLAQGTRPCATIWYASSPSRSAQNQPLRNASKKQSYTPTSIMRSQLASRGSDMSDSHMKKPDLRRGWGLRRGMRIASSERPPPPLPWCINDERCGEAKGRLHAQETRPFSKGLGKCFSGAKFSDSG